MKCKICGKNSQGEYCFQHKKKAPLKRTPLKKKPPKKVPANARSEKPYKRKPAKRKKRPLKKVLWEWYSRHNRLFHSDENGMCKCFTCDYVAFWKGEQIQCGHFQSRKHLSTFIHPNNCRPQCSACNSPRIGNGRNYEFGKNLDKQMGEGTADAMVALARESKSYTQYEYQQMIDFYKSETFKLLEEKGLQL